MQFDVKKPLTLLAAALLALSLAGCMGMNKKESEETFQDFAYGKAEQSDMSADQFERMGDTQLARNQAELAFVQYNRSLTLDPENNRVRNKKANLLLGKNQLEQALAEYQRVLKNAPDDPQANEGAGLVYFRVGLFDEARTHLERALTKDPLLWKAYNYLGIIADRKGDYDTAAKNFTAALSLHQGPGADEIYNNLGVVHIARGENQLAVDAFRKALEMGGISSRTYNNLGLALARLEHYNEALEAFGYAGGEARANNNLGFVLLTDGKPDLAIPYFERAIELAPKYYIKAAENLKRARMAARFKTAKNDGSTPNPLLRKPFPGTEQQQGGVSASPAVETPPTPKAEKIAYGKKGQGVTIDLETVKPVYGLHISSWQEMENAFHHCEMLQKQGYETWVNRVDLGEKGVWYRVLVGRFATIKQAQQARPEVRKNLEIEHRATVYELRRPEVGVSA